MASSAESGAAGPSSQLDCRGDSRRESWTHFWLSYLRILLIQVAVLLALAGAFVAYLNWSSAKAFAEFLSAGTMAAPSNPSVQSIKGVNPCDRGA